MKEISPQELKKLIDEKADFMLVDVREEYEFDEMNINGKLIPMGEVMSRMDEIPRDKKVVVHCKSGIMHVGGSSIRVLHKMWNARTGELCAQLSQFGVHLDMAARRPKALPEEIKSKGLALLVKS